MIYLILFSFLFAAEPDVDEANKQAPAKDKQTSEAQIIKQQKRDALKEAAQQLGNALNEDNPTTSELLEIEDRLNLSRNQPMYFAFGDPLTKVQLSFKYRLVKNMPLYFGFTQILFWDLGEDSKPFKDTTYNPEFMYRYSIKDNSYIKSIDFGIWEHNSNGKDGPASRSFERAYVRANFEHEYDKWILRFSTKLGYIYGLDKTNKDIQDYISPLELKFTLVEVFRGMLDKSELSLRFFPGGKYADKFSNGGFELGMSFRFGGLDIIPAFYMQYFNGYAESMINYDQRVNEFRAGFIF